MLDDLLDNKNVLSISVIYNKSPYRKASLLITFYGLKCSFMYLSYVLVEKQRIPKDPTGDQINDLPHSSH
jgi:hypothetical protein